jgi:hypothetical protein
VVLAQQRKRNRTASAYRRVFLTGCFVHEAKKLLRLAPLLALRFAQQLFLELLVLDHLIGALPNFFPIGFRPIKIPSQPGGYFHVHQLLLVTSGRAAPVMDNNVWALIGFLISSI